MRIWANIYKEGFSLHHTKDAADTADKLVGYTRDKCIPMEPAELAEFLKGEVIHPTNDQVNATLDERQKTHGDYEEHARITQRLKMVVRSELRARGGVLNFQQQESIDMILHKIGRIISGNPDYADHWLDIAGYATLIVRSLERQSASHSLRATDREVLAGRPPASS